MADDITIDVQANTDDASSSLMSLADGIMIAFGEKIVDAIGAAFTFVTDQLQEFVSMAGEAEEVGALFNSTLEGSALADYGSELEDLAQSLQKTTRFEDESILSAETVILRYSEIGHDVFPRVTATSLDLAESMKTTAEGGAQMLGRALSDIANGSLSALKRSRLLSQETIDQATAMAKAGDSAGAQTLILDALDKKIGNVAETMAGTFNGAMDKFKISIDNIKEGIGAKLLPLLTPLIQKFQDLAERYAPLLGEMFDVVIVPAITALIDKIVPLVDEWLPKMMDGVEKMLEPGSKFVSMIQGIGQSLNNLFNVNVDAGALFAPLKLGLFGLAVFWNEQGPAIQKIAQETFGKLSVIFSDLAEKVLPWLAEKFHQLGNWFIANGPLITKFIQVLADQFAGTIGAIAAAWPILQAILDGIISGFLRMATFVMQIMTGDFGGAFEKWKAGFGETFAAIGNVIKAFGDWIGSFFGTTWAKTTAQWGAFFTGLIQMVSSQFTTILNSIILTMALIVSGIYLKIVEIQTNFSVGVTNWLSAIGDKLGEFTAMGDALIGNILNSIRNKLGEFVTTGETLVNNFLNPIRGKVGEFLTMGETLVNNFKNGVSNTWSSFSSMVSSNFDSVVSNFTQKISGFTNIGATIVSNLKSGISNNWGAFSSWISGQIQAIIDNLLGAIGLPGAGSSESGGGGSIVAESTTNPSAPTGTSSSSQSSGPMVTYNFGPVTQTFSGKPDNSFYGAG